MTTINLNNYTLSSLKFVFPEWDVKIFCLPLSLPVKHGVDFKITNTAQKRYVQMCDFHNKEKSSQDILMLAKHTHINCTSCCCFLDHNPATGSFQAIAAEISFVGSLTSFKSSWSTCIVVLSLSDSSLHCFHYLKKYDKGFGLFSAIIKVFCSHSSLEIESKMAPTL